MLLLIKTMRTGKLEALFAVIALKFSKISLQIENNMILFVASKHIQWHYGRLDREMIIRYE